MVLYVTMHCGLQFSFWHWLVGVNTMLVSQLLSELIWAFCIQVVRSYTGVMNWVQQIQIVPEGSYCLRCAQHERSKNDRGFVCHVDTIAEQNTQANWIILFTLKYTGTFCQAVAEVSEKKVLQVPVHFSNIFLYICIYLLCIYYKIARIKVLASLASLVGTRVKAVSVKRINYLYRCGIEASSNYNLFYPLYYVSLITSKSILQMRILKVIKTYRGHYLY